MNVLRRPVLILEDDSSIRSWLQEVLEHEGHEVHAAASAEDALELLTRPELSCPCLLLLDVQLPRIDGLQFLAAVRAQREGDSVVMMSADPVNEARARDVGIRHFLSKPFGIDALISTVRQLAGGAPTAMA